MSRDRVAPRRRRRLAAWVAIVSLAGLGGCAPVDGEDIERTSAAMVATENGLLAVNGFNTHNIITAQNGIGFQNGLSPAVGLGAPGGISSSHGFMTTPEGRTFLQYLVRCAMPKNVTISAADPTGTMSNFPGELGLAPQWQLNACDQPCQEVLTSCLMALTNRDSRHVTVELVSSSQTSLFTVGSSLDSVTYPNQEGVVFGNMFASPPQLYACTGTDSTKAEQVKRYCIDNTGCDVFKKAGSCASVCTMTNCTTGYDGRPKCSASSCSYGGRSWNAPLTIFLPNKISVLDNDGAVGATAAPYFNGLAFAGGGDLTFKDVQFGLQPTATKTLEVTLESPSGGFISVSLPQGGNTVPLGVITVSPSAILYTTSLTIDTSRLAAWQTVQLGIIAKGPSFGVIQSIELH